MDGVEILGLTAAFFTTVANVPQAVKTIRTRSTKGISAATYSILSLGLLLWVVYGLYQSDLPIILSNAVAALLCLSILAIKLLNLKNGKEKKD